MSARDHEEFYPEAYVQYLIEFHATRDYFECHELLEEYWKSQTDDPLSEQWVGLIQLAVGSYHHRRGNFAGAVKMFGQARLRLKADRLRALGLNGDELLASIDQRITSAQANVEFVDLNIPIADPKLQTLCDAKCAEEGLVWGVPSSDDQTLTDRHRLRDRSDVIAARQAAIEARASKA